MEDKDRGRYPVFSQPFHFPLPLSWFRNRLLVALSLGVIFMVAGLQGLSSDKWNWVGVMVVTYEGIHSWAAVTSVRIQWRKRHTDVRGAWEWRLNPFEKESSFSFLFLSSKMAEYKLQPFPPEISSSSLYFTFCLCGLTYEIWGGDDEFLRGLKS